MSKSPMQQISIVIGATTAALILVAAGALLFTNIIVDVLPYPKRTYAGYMFLAYGIFRLARLYFQFKSKV
jgi:hypothetical protein